MDTPPTPRALRTYWTVPKINQHKISWKDRFSKKLSSMLRSSFIEIHPFSQSWKRLSPNLSHESSILILWNNKKIGVPVCDVIEPEINFTRNRFKLLPICHSFIICLKRKPWQWCKRLCVENCILNVFVIQHKLEIVKEWTTEMIIRDWKDIEIHPNEYHLILLIFPYPLIN